jgi:hypothetical protein
MPCYTPPPSQTELERARLNDFLDEIGERTPRTEQEFVRKSRNLTTDEMTRTLCSWCQRNDVTKKSLELQIWWRDHQKWDREREAAEKQEQERKRLRKSALSKLTPAERKALKLT